MKLLLGTLSLFSLVCLLSSCESTNSQSSGGGRPNVNNEVMQDGLEGVGDDELGDETVPTEIERKF